MSGIAVVRAHLAKIPPANTVAERRAQYDRAERVFPMPADVSVKPVQVPAISAEWIEPAAARDGTFVLYLHGGGYVIGSPKSHRHLAASIAVAGRASALLPDYRLAPEHPFPAAYDDALNAWRFFRNQGIDAAKIAIGGDSAGAGLTLGLVGWLRDAHEELPGCVWLISPWTDLTMSGSTLVSKAAADPLIHKEYLNELADAYVPAGMDRKDPRVSPLYADLTNFPSMLIQVGSEETLLDDAVRLAARAGAAEVAVTLEIWPQMIHAWPLWNAHLEDGRRAIANAGEFIRTHL